MKKASYVILQLLQWNHFHSIEATVSAFFCSNSGTYAIHSFTIVLWNHFHSTETKMIAFFCSNSGTYTIHSFTIASMKPFPQHWNKNNCVFFCSNSDHYTIPSFTIASMKPFPQHWNVDDCFFLLKFRYIHNTWFYHCVYETISTTLKLWWLFFSAEENSGTYTIYSFTIASMKPFPKHWNEDDFFFPAQIQAHTQSLLSPSKAYSLLTVTVIWG